ncbi:hypothetical protein RND81_02G013500 [Saponaria officinalis]|uniref:GTD-binding domain-containing protein n=1 Tax=Saponaria officinalis TaxID=3572 RepID=A0AAW1MLY6_SAPOF
METTKFTNMLNKKTNKITKILKYIFLEWTLIFLLLINSLFSYLILKFALYFGLKPPCLFCSRVDHVINSQKNNQNIISSYTKLICEQHASEISNFGYCSLHRKLVEFKNLCDDCSSISDKKRAFCDDTNEGPLFKWMNEIGIVEEFEDEVIKKCSCCDLIINNNHKKVCDSSYFDYMANLITENELNGCYPDEENRDLIKFDQFDSGYHVLDDVDDDDHDDHDGDDDDGDGDFVFEAEKEPLLSKIDDNINNNNDNNQQHLEFYVDHDDYRLIPVEIVGKSVKIESKSEEIGEKYEMIETLVEEICGEDVDFVIEKDELLGCCKNLPSIQEEEEGEGEILVSVAAEVAVEAAEVVEEVAEVVEEEVVESTTHVLKEMVENGVHSASADYREEMECYLSKDECVTNEVSIEVSEHPTTINDNGVCEVSNRSVQLSLPSSDDNDAEIDAEKENGVDTSNNEIEEDKIPDTPNSTETLNMQIPEKVRSLGTWGSVIADDEIDAEEENRIDTSNNEIEEDEIPDTPNSSETLDMEIPENVRILGTWGSVTEESVDGNSIKGDQNDCADAATLIKKLKTEVEAERKTLRALYKELEEERNAAAVAANQTLAMINRLQEEKTAMQMEAIQYQRMMEEQSEYDQEALQMMNELMVKREKEKLELEKEIEVYRKKLSDFEEREKMRILSRRMEGSLRSRNSSASCSFGEESDGLSVDLNHHEVKDHEEDGCGGGENGNQDTPVDSVLNLQESLGCFEDERQSILEQLKVLEEKLFTLAEEEEDEDDEDNPENTGRFEELYEENDGENGVTHVNGKHEEGWLNGSMPKRLLPLFDEVELSSSPDQTFVNKSSSITKFELEKKRLAIEEEVDHVYERLHALEADREFLKHCVGSLRKGDKGLDLLQEILQHLRDLKNVELQVMKNSV